MRTAIALIGLGVAEGLVPTGLAHMSHAGVVVAGTAGALTVLVTLCLVAPVLARHRRGATRPEPVGGAFDPAVPQPRSLPRGI